MTWIINLNPCAGPSKVEAEEVFCRNWKKRGLKLVQNSVVIYCEMELWRVILRALFHLWDIIWGLLIGLLKLSLLNSRSFLAPSFESSFPRYTSRAVFGGQLECTWLECSRKFGWKTSIGGGIYDNGTIGELGTKEEEISERNSSAV